MSNNAARIAELRREADALEAADKAFLGLPDEHKLAITLHKMLCHWNHTDGCSWEYESKKIADGVYEADWTGYAHQSYLTKAQRVMTFCSNHKISTDTAVDLMKLINSYS